jgi:two-component system, chemotaxis family, CheB/CheR fusion protein
MLVGELNHRVKNLFAIVRALATQANGGRTAGHYRQVFLGRVDALARTHDLLFASEWHGPSCMRSRAPCSRPTQGWPQPSRSTACSSSSAPGRRSRSAWFYTSWLPMPPTTVPSRYLSWRIEGGDGGRRICLTWKERGGPPVPPPRETGFGTQLIRRAFDYELDGTADLSFGPEGLRLEATFPSR